MPLGQRQTLQDPIAALRDLNPDRVYIYLPDPLNKLRKATGRIFLPQTPENWPKQSDASRLANFIYLRTSDVSKGNFVESVVDEVSYKDYNERILICSVWICDTSVNPLVEFYRLECLCHIQINTIISVSFVRCTRELNRLAVDGYYDISKTILDVLAVRGMRFLKSVA